MGIRRKSYDLYLVTQRQAKPHALRIACMAERMRKQMTIIIHRYTGEVGRRNNEAENGKDGNYCRIIHLWLKDCR